MLWIIYNSYKRNLRSYRFAIIALAMATLVSSLGLSGVELMASMWRYPMVQANGGQIQLLHVESTGGSWDKFSLFSFSKARDIVKEVYPEAEVTATLWVPVTYGEDNRPGQIKGRSGGLSTWYLMPPLAEGSSLGQGNLHDKVFLTLNGRVGTSLSLRIASYHAVGERNTWQLIGAEEQSFAIIGRPGYPDPGGAAMGHLGVIQRLSNTPEDLVHIVGVALPGLQSTGGDRFEGLRSRLTTEMPEVAVMSVDEYFKANIYGLDQLRKAASLYTPVVLLIALQVVIATALAVVHSRRRELALLRIIGFSYRKVWMLFTLECTLSALTACGLGVVLAKLAALTIFHSANISLMPFALADRKSVV